MTHTNILDKSDIICQRRRLAMACGCRDTVTDPVTGLSGAVEATDAAQGTLWARVGNERLAAWVPAGRLVVGAERPLGRRVATPPAARPQNPDSEPPQRIPCIPSLRALTPVAMTVVVGMNPTLTEAEVPVVVGDEKETVRP